MKDLHLIGIHLRWEIRRDARDATYVDVCGFGDWRGQRDALVARAEKDYVEFLVVRGLTRCDRRIQTNPEIVATFATDHGLNHVSAARGVWAINVEGPEPSKQAPSVTTLDWASVQE